jgi:CheY-like chemotaxis protein
VVDDDFRNVFALTALLERGHAEVIPAESGPDALAILQGPVEVDLVLMDIRMPGMDGYTAIRSIRLLAECATLPIVCITSNVTSGERERCMGAGANDYVPKPLDTVQLLAAIGPWLASREESDK